MAQRTCSIDGCEKKPVARGWCPMHYQRWKTTGTTEGGRRPANTQCKVPGCNREPRGSYCSMHARRKWRTGSVGPVVTLAENRPTVCSVDGCENGGKLTRGWCKMHWYRWRRHGDPEALLVDGTARSLMQHGYVIVYKHGHPLADKKGRVYEHRAVLYAVIGPEDHPCHWCGETLSWFAEERKRRIVVDHLNHERSDNDPANVVPSCGPCNTSRERQSRHMVA